MKSLILAIAFLLLSASADAQSVTACLTDCVPVEVVQQIIPESHPAFKLALGTYLSAAVADLATTEYQLGHGAHEQLLGSGLSPAGLGATKLALMGVLTAETAWLAKHRHARLATVILLVDTAAESSFAIHNARIGASR